MGYEAHQVKHKGELGKAIDELKADVAALKKRVKDLEDQI